MAGFKGAIFDMDGTLLESMVEWRKQNETFCVRHGLPVPEELRGRILETSSHKAAKLFVDKYPQLGMTPDEIIAEYERCLDPLYCSVVQKKKGILEFLRMLKDNGVRMCVATTTAAPVARHALEHHGIAPFMDFIIDNSSVGLSKGNPAYFPRVAGMLGLSADDCVVFEDAEYAVTSAHEAGMRVFAVRDACAHGSWDAIAEKAVALRDDYTGLQPLIEAMFRADHVCTMQLAGKECE